MAVKTQRPGLSRATTTLARPAPAPTFLALIWPLALFWGISLVADLTVRTLHIPVASNALAMLAMCALLATGLVSADEVRDGSALLVRNLSFFFVPFAAGMLEVLPQIASIGAALATVIVVSCGLGIAVTGLVAAAFERRASS